MTGQLTRLLGGSPVAVLLRLAVLSLFVGAVMAGLGLSPGLLLQRGRDLFASLFGYGFEAVRNAGGYVLAGSVVVVPLWLLGRLMAARR